MNTPHTSVSAKTTQKCTKCKVEKTLEDFHKRGAGHQTICKACRLSDTRPHVKRQKRDNSANFEAITSRIVANEEKLRHISERYAQDEDTAGDIYSHICETMLKRMRPDVSDPYFFTVAHRAAKTYLAIERNYTFYVASEDEIGGGNSDNGRMDDPFETHVFTVSGDNASAESLIIEKERREEIMKALASLSPESKLPPP